MRIRTKGLVLAAAHLAFVLGLGGKFLLDRATRPRFWLKAAPVDPTLPIRGRYVSLSVSIPVSGREIALDMRPRDAWVEYLKSRNGAPIDPKGKRPASFSPNVSWVRDRSIPQVRIEFRGAEAWGHLEQAPEGTPGLLRRNPGGFEVRRSVGIDLSEDEAERASFEPPSNLAVADLDRWLDALPPGRIALGDSLAFFIPEHVPDPSIRAAGESLWVEVTLPKKGPLRPIRLAVKTDGKFTVLNL